MNAYIRRLLTLIGLAGWAGTAGLACLAGFTAGMIAAAGLPFLLSDSGGLARLASVAVAGPIESAALSGLSELAAAVVLNRSDVAAELGEVAAAAAVAHAAGPAGVAGFAGSAGVAGLAGLVGLAGLAGRARPAPRAPEPTTTN